MISFTDFSYFFFSFAADSQSSKLSLSRVFSVAFIPAIDVSNSDFSSISSTIFSSSRSDSSPFAFFSSLSAFSRALQSFSYSFFFASASFIFLVNVPEALISFFSKSSGFNPSVLIPINSSSRQSIILIRICSSNSSQEVLAFSALVLSIFFLF